MPSRPYLYVNKQLIWEGEAPAEPEPSPIAVHAKNSVHAKAPRERRPPRLALLGVAKNSWCNPSRFP